MNKKIITGFVVLAVLIITISIFLLFPKIKELNIKSEIEKANYCEVESDCVNVGAKCPFGCYIYVNKNEVEQISKLIQSYNSNCIYSCILCPTVICDNNKCKEVCE